MKKHFKELLEDFIQAIDELATERAIRMYNKRARKTKRNLYAVEVIDLNDF